MFIMLEILFVNVITAKQTAIMPDYVMPYTIHLLAHEPDLKNWKDIETLQRIEKLVFFQ